jgi:zona occludens toxin (predicted ATPase)
MLQVRMTLSYEFHYKVRDTLAGTSMTTSTRTRFLFMLAVTMVHETAHLFSIMKQGLLGINSEPKWRLSQLGDHFELGESWEVFSLGCLP